MLYCWHSSALPVKYLRLGSLHQKPWNWGISKFPAIVGTSTWNIWEWDLEMTCQLTLTIIYSHLHTHAHTHTAEELTIYLNSWNQTPLIDNCAVKKSGSLNLKTSCILWLFSTGYQTILLLSLSSSKFCLCVSLEIGANTSLKLAKCVKMDHNSISHYW